MSLLNREGPPEPTAEEQIARGQHAARLLQDEVLRAAYEDAERRLLVEWLEGQKVEQREAAWAKIHAIDEIRRALRRFVDAGEYAARKRR